MKTISIIVPVYNAEKFLDRCVNSLVNQTYRDLEIILIDDGSPDNCPQMCDEWAKKDKRIKVIHKENGGPSAARNSGLDAATGDYITFVDSDDYIELDCYEKTLKSNCDVTVFGYTMITKETQKVSIKEKEYINNNEDFFNESFVGHMFNPLWNKVYKREVLDSVRFDTAFKFGEDYKFNMEMLKNVTTVKMLDYCGYNYVIEENSTSITKTEVLNKKVESFLMQVEMTESLSTNLNKDVAYVFLAGLFNEIRLFIKTAKDSKAQAVEVIKEMKQSPIFKKLLKTAKPRTFKESIVKFVMKLNSRLICFACKFI